MSDPAKYRIICHAPYPDACLRAELSSQVLDLRARIAELEAERDEARRMFSDLWRYDRPVDGHIWDKWHETAESWREATDE